MPKQDRKTKGNHEKQKETKRDDITNQQESEHQEKDRNAEHQDQHQH